MVAAPTRLAASAPGTGARPAALGIRLGVWAATALFGVLLTCWAFVTPVFRAPDEPNHVDTVLRLVEGGGYPRAGETFVGEEVLVAQTLAWFVKTPGSDVVTERLPFPVPASAAIPRGERPAFDELGVDGPVPRKYDQLTQHPPLYYLVAAGALAGVPGSGDWAFDRQVGFLRLLDVFFLLPIPVCAFAVARRLARSDAVGVAAAFLPAAIPQLTHIGGSVTNDTFITLSGALLAVVTTRVALGETTRRFALLSAGAAVLGLLTKAFALVYVPWVALAWLAGLVVVGPGRRRTAFGHGLLAVGLTVLGGGWWYVLNVVRYGTPQPDGAPRYPPGVRGEDLAVFTGQFLARLSTSFWGNFSWLEVALPGWFVTVATVLLVLASIAGVIAAAGWPARLAASAAGIALLGNLALVYQQSLKNYRLGSYFAGLQGRYLFGFVVVLAALGAVGAAAVVGTRVLPVLAVLAVLVSQSLGLGVFLTTVWEPAGGTLDDAAQALRVWSAWPPAVLAGAVTALGAAVALALIAAVRVAEPVEVPVVPPAARQPVSSVPAAERSVEDGVVAAPGSRAVRG